MAYTSNPTVTRPANTTAYAAGDVVGGVIEFANFVPYARAVMLCGADLSIHVNSIPSGMTSFRLHLYRSTPPSAIADNAAWDLPSGDRSVYAGYVDIGTPTDTGATLYAQNDTATRVVFPAGTSLYGYLVTTGGFTPAGNSEVYVPGIQGIDP